LKKKEKKKGINVKDKSKRLGGVDAHWRFAATNK